MHKPRFCFLVLLVLSLIAGPSLGAMVHDLKDLKQPFVLKTKKIKIPGYPNAFNPSIVKWNGKTLMSFRIRDPLTASTDQMGLVWLTDDFELASSPVILKRYNENVHAPTSAPSFAQDPRLIILNNELHVVYNNIFTMPSGKIARRMVMGAVDYDGTHFVLHHPCPILLFDGYKHEKQEKNWVPFVYQNAILLSYSISPHRVLFPVPLENTCLPFSTSPKRAEWDWGILRGGTTALKVGNQYLGFFHSVKDMTTVQSGYENMAHYFMGAYTFEADPPFAVTGMSPKPIVANSFYEGPMYQTWKPLRVVFPGGFIHDKDFIWVAYGRQDHEIWVVKFDKQGLLNSLIPVE